MGYILKDMPQVGAVVILVILGLFIVAVTTMLLVYFRYRRFSRQIADGEEVEDGFLCDVREEFAAVFKDHGKETNTPAIIESVMGQQLSRLLLAERFLNNAVSIFVTLGLFGTFLGLSMSVTSLTKLISYSNTSEWLSVLDSVGGGLMSALSGMGVAFYTSLVGAGCSIVLTLLRTVFNPQSQREKLAVQLELWLDHTVAPALPNDADKDDATLVRQMIAALDSASESMKNSLNAASDSMKATLNESGETLRRTMEGSRPYLVAFHQTVEKFNTGVREFSEYDYNLRGSAERLDLAVRDLSTALRRLSAESGKGEQQ